MDSQIPIPDSQIPIPDSQIPIHGIEIDDSVCDDLDNDSQTETASGNSSINRRRRKRPRRKTSVYRHYFKVLPREPGKKLMCKCIFCGSEYCAETNQGTSNLKRHLEICKKTTLREVGHLLLSPSLRTSSKFDPEKFRELLIIAIIKHELPLRFAEYDAIRALFSYLNEGVKHICRNTVKSDVLRLYNQEKERLRDYFGSITSRINLTSDLWTSIATDGYISLTAHYIDDDWKLNKRLLNFSLMLPPHTGIAICEKIYSLLVDWKIEQKLFSITLDNASANCVFVDLLRNQLSLKKALLGDGELFHIRCCAHVLNLIVNDGLKLIDESVEKIRETIKYVRGSQVRKHKFLECVSYVSLECKRGLRQDVPTRWDSTYEMLDNALYYQNAFMHLNDSDSNYTFCPTFDEWVKIRKIAKFLGVFHCATCKFSGTKYPTSNLFFPEVFKIEHTLKVAMNDQDMFIKNMADVMYMKFGKYWKEYNTILAVACALDPRYKMQFVEFSYTKLHGLYSDEFSRVKTKIFSLYAEYESRFSKDVDPTTLNAPRKETQVFDADPFGLDVLKEFDTFEGLEFADNSNKTELELYLAENKLERSVELDVLSFWKTNQHRYPILARMAKDVLAVPVTTVASESAFSVGGRILDEFRSALKPDTFEALVCTRDWIYGKENNDFGVKLKELTEDIIRLGIDEGTMQTQNPIL